MNQGIRLGCFLLQVVLDHLVVAVPGQLVGAIHPEELPVDRVIDANDALIALSIGAQDRLIRSEEPVAALDHQLTAHE